MARDSAIKMIIAIMGLKSIMPIRGTTREIGLSIRSVIWLRI